MQVTGTSHRLLISIGTGQAEHDRNLCPLWLPLWLPQAAWGLLGQVLLLATVQGGSRLSMGCLKDLQKWIWIHWAFPEEGGGVTGMICCYFILLFGYTKA